MTLCCLWPDIPASPTPLPSYNTDTCIRSAPMEPHQNLPRIPPPFWSPDGTPLSTFAHKILTRFTELPARLSRSRAQLLLSEDFLDVRHWQRGGSSTEELVVFALLFNDDATSTTIADWIGRYFFFYQPVRFASRLRVFPIVPQNIEARKSFHRDVEITLCGLELPVRRDFRGDTPAENQYNVDLPAARISIKSMFGSDQTMIHPFRFLDLPLEVRMIVYDMVLSFPDSGIVIRQERLVPMVYTATRRIKQKVTWQDWNRLETYDLSYGKPLGTYLEILATSKQMYAESMPFFYSNNCFVFWDFPALTQFFTSTSPSRLARVHHLMFDYLPKDLSVTREPLHRPVSRFNVRALGERHLSHPKLSILKTCKALAQMPGLQSLHIGFSETYWRGLRKSRGVARFPNVLDVTGLRILRKMRGLKSVVFHGACDVVRADMVPEMTKPKEAEKGARKQQAKRKRELKETRMDENVTYGQGWDHDDEELLRVLQQCEEWGHA